LAHILSGECWSDFVNVFWSPNLDIQECFIFRNSFIKKQYRMSLVKKVRLLSQDLQANLDQLVENRLIEIGAMPDPYDLSDEQRKKLDQQLDEKEEVLAESNSLDDYSEHLKSDWEAENPGGNYTEYVKEKEKMEQQFELVAAEIAVATDQDELFEVYEITQQAVGAEEENYGSSTELTREEWDKMNARFFGK
jgi:hypothetical protein